MPRNLHLATLLLAILPAAAARAADVRDKSATTDVVTSMPAIRRIAVAPVRSNLDEFRRFLKEDAGQLAGFAALPLNEEQASVALTESMAKALERSGRFWTLAVETTVDVLGGQKSEQSLQESRARLQKQYDLDVWLETELRFSPDHTRIRVTMKGARSSGKDVWAREDVLTISSPSEADVARAFSTAVARLMGTLGHDGRITWQKDDMAVVDFGVERGLAPGQRLDAGYVALSARHPVTFEFLRSKRLRILELEVVEARQGSAVCRLLRKNDVAEREAQPLVNSAKRVPMLAWRSEEMREERLSQKDEASGSAAGFPPDTAVKMVQTPASVRPPSPASGTSVARPVPVSAPSDTPETPTREEGENEKPFPWSDIQSIDFSTWRLTDLSLGTGTAFGALETSNGSRSTGIASAFLNLLNVEANIVVTPLLRLAPEASLASFGGNEVKGQKFDLLAPALMRVWGGEKSPTGALDIGAGVSFSVGSASTEIQKSGRKTIVEQGFTAPDLLGQGVYSLALPGLGKASGTLSLYLFEILLGEGTGTEVKVSLQPDAVLPKPLGFWFRGRIGPDIWSAGELGVKWSFIHEE